MPTKMFSAMCVLVSLRLSVACENLFLLNAFDFHCGFNSVSHAIAFSWLVFLCWFHCKEALLCDGFRDSILIFTCIGWSFATHRMDGQR